MGQGITHAGLGREIHHPVDGLIAEQRLHPRAIGQIHSMERKTRPLDETGEAGFLESDLVIIIEIIQADDLLAAIGYGKFAARSILARLAPASTEGAAPEEKSDGGLTSVVRRVFGGDSSAIVVKGHDDLLVYRARCCNPIRGEDVVGYVTRGKGVAVHAKSCPNVQNLMYEADRRIDVEWGRKEVAKGAYPVKLTVLCDDRAGMLKQMTALISDENTNIRNIVSKPLGDHQATIDLVVEIEDLTPLERIIGGLRKIPGVHDVQRIQKI
jgi:GTP pyrophosphokinase